MPWCMGVSCPSFLLPGGLLGKGVMWVAVLGLILSSVAGAGGGLGLTRSVCHQPQVVPNCAALAARVAPTLLWGTVERGRRCTVGHKEAGCGQAQHLPRSSLWGPCLGKLMVFGSVLQSRDPAVNSIKAVLGKGGINYPDEKDE